jgi:Zn-dependent protease with chaperone function
MRRHVTQLALALSGLTTIATSIATSREPAAFIPQLLQPGGWPHGAVWVLAPVLAAIVVAWLARLVFILTRAALTLRRLPFAGPPPARMVASIGRTGADRVRCIAGDMPIAFCAGALRPEIFVSECLADELDDQELDAVLLHEHHHLREREPLARAAWEAAAQVLFFFPLARWWSRQRIEVAELRADEAAVRKVGPRPVATALRTLGTARPSGAPFAGVAELRVAQLLGDPLPAQRPPAEVVVASLLGFPFALAVGGCLVQIAVHLLSR